MFTRDFKVIFCALFYGAVAAALGAGVLIALAVMIAFGSMTALALRQR